MATPVNLPLPVVRDLRLITAPAAAVMTLAEAKAQCRTDDSTDDDAFLQTLVDTATAMLDGPAGLLGRCLVNQTWKMSFDYAFPFWRIPLPLATLVSVDKVEYVDNAGATQILDPTTYVVLDGPIGALEPAFGRFWPSPRSQVRAVTITFTAGYGADASKIPAPLKAAMKLLVSHLYEHRDAVVGVEGRDSSTPIPLGVADLIAPFRARSVA